MGRLKVILTNKVKVPLVNIAFKEVIYKLDITQQCLK